MITVVSGKLGAGKSLDMVRMMREHLGRGGCVRTNIRLSSASMTRSLGRRVLSAQIGGLSASDNPTTIPTGDRRGRGKRRTMVVLDEALNWFQSEGAGTESADVKERRRAWGEWLRQSDKLGQDVYFIAQNFERAAKWIRELAQLSREVIPLRSVRIGWFLPLWWLFPPLRTMYAVLVFDVRSRTRQAVEFHRYDKSLFQLYDTSETFGFVGAASAYDGVALWPVYQPPLRPLWLSLWLLAPAVYAAVTGIWS